MIKKKVLSGVKWTALSNIVLSILQMLQVSILARFLSPNDFGLMAIVMVIIGFSRIFSDMGISNAIIHYQNTSHEQLSSLYWLNIFSGIVLFLLISLFSPLIAQFYEEPELVNLLVLLGSIFIVLAIGNQYRILLQKELLFNLMAKIEMSATLSAFIIAIICAVSGLGVYSLAYATLANALISTSLYLFIGLRKHKPSFVYNHHSIEKYINFGLFQMGENILNFFNAQFDVILIGKLLGIEILGIYSVMKQLVMKPAGIVNPIINRVAFPVMAKVQNDDLILQKIYLKIINAISSINFPIYISIVILAEPIVLIMFGNEFKAGIPILQVLSIYAMFRSTSNPIGSLLMAKGRVDIGFYWNALLFVFIPLTIFIGSGFGILGVSYALLFLQVFLMIPSWFFVVKRLCGVSFISFFSQIFIPLILSLIAASIAMTISSIILSESMKIMAVLLIGFLSYIFLSILFNKEFINTVMKFKR
jgi:O-antigen/teichoic acid export membrane protein